jgi:hypothetical protein
MHQCVVHHRAIEMAPIPSLRIPRFQHESRINHDDLTVAETALGNGCGTGERRPGNPDNGEQAHMDSLLHVLAEVLHLDQLA